MKIDVIIPALNEAQSIGNALRAIPSWVRHIVVADNGSTDDTAEIAASLGATVVRETRRGYGAACLAALSRLGREPPDVVIFMDADGSDLPEEMESLVLPIRNGEADLVIGSRVLSPGRAQPGSLTMPQRFGNALASFLIRRLWKVPCTDLGPFRAIRFSALRELAMDDLDYGWTVQMQARAANRGLRIVEVPVSYRKRIGKSKISGTIRGVVGAGTKILGSITAEATRCNAPRSRLIIFSRVPKAGTTKTRLVPALGERAAAQLQAAMTKHTLDIARVWSRQFQGCGEVEIRFTGGSADEMVQHFGCDPGGRYVAQGDGDLGDRLAAAFDAAFDDGVHHALAIGCDCPDLTPTLIGQAIERLRDTEIVIGPANDGGYYLIGMNRGAAAPAHLFREIDWGSEQVFSQTCRNAKAKNWSVETLIELGDVDEPEDLHRWQAIACRIESPAQPLASIIIPALNEAERLPETIAAARQSSNVEIIVVDGGSQDGTPELAASLGAHVIVCSAQSRSRAAQMNLGAKEVRSDVLVFLHADTRLPFDYLDDVERVRHDQCPVAIAFRFAFDTLSPSLRLIERGAKLRSRWLGLPYGDQGLVIRRDTFERMGGFAEMPVMEDYEFILRLRRYGAVRLSRRAAITSARRWLGNGVWRTTLRHQLAIVAYSVGLPIDRIASFLGRNGLRDLEDVNSESGPPKESRTYASACNR